MLTVPQLYNDKNSYIGATELIINSALPAEYMQTIQDYQNMYG